MIKQKINGLDIGIYIVTLFFTLLCFYPFYYVFINTISDNDLVVRGDVVLYPLGLQFRNYLEIFKINELPHAAFISVARTVVGTAFTLISSAFLGYCMTKHEYWYRKFWYRFIIITMYFNAGVIPWYLLMNSLRLTNNFFGYILPALVSPFNLILIKTYIESIPISLEESAEIDGAGYIIRFTKITLPLAQPIMATIAVFAAVGQWNSFMDTVYLMTDSRYFTLQFLLYKFLKETDQLANMMRSGAGVNAAAMVSAQQITPMGVHFTVTMVTLIPILLVYPFFQRYFVKGIMIGAVKG
ncbi:MAG: carbohydrate ABC transporter permease [Treponema sp.]|jgi:putative aldouronate transport system permease protein|nr:carbohydrate ABC transporter permease [Treponema sp.]